MTKDDRSPSTLSDPSRRAAITGGAALAAGAAAASLGTTSAAAQTQSGPTAAKQLAGQTALVTGAARAIGRAIAIELGKEGADVALLDIADPDAIPGIGYPLASREDLDEAVSLVEATGSRAIPIVGDVRDSAAMTNAVAETERAFGRPLDIACVNAGIVPRAALSEMTDQQWRDAIDVNLTGAANTIRAAMPGMAARGSGRIIATASSVGRHGQAGISHYVASKWGLIGLVKSAALEAGPSNVTVNAVAPTAVDSVRKPTGEALERANAYLTSYYNALPIAFLEPDAVAHAVVFLASPKAAFVTGEIMDIAAGANARYTA